jgi:hypothetical protein
MNINNEVLVRLTPQGHARLMANHAELFKGQRHAPEYEPPKRTADGWDRFQLWHLMQQFGPHIFMGMPGQFFVNNEVRLPAPAVEPGAVVGWTWEHMGRHFTACERDALAIAEHPAPVVYKVHLGRPINKPME